MRGWEGDSEMEGDCIHRYTHIFTVLVIYEKKNDYHGKNLIGFLAYK